MSSEPLPLLLLATAVGCGVVGGIFFAFSNFVMKALARLPASQGAAAMQAINVVVLNPFFLGAFMGTAVLSLASAVVGLWSTHACNVPLLLTGAALYVFGTFGVTIVGNVPLNDRLAATPSSSPGIDAVWRDFVVPWTRWNHVRTLAAIAACAALIAALPDAP